MADAPNEPLEQPHAEDVADSPRPASRQDAVDAFIIYNERETVVERIAGELEQRRVKTYFWRRDIPIGSAWLEVESQHLRAASAVVVLLGGAGWGPNHRALAEQALRLERRILPVLIGQPPEGDEAALGGLFRDRRYLDLRELDPGTLDRLAAEILGDEPVSAQSFEAVIQTFVDGSDEERSTLLRQIVVSETIDRMALAARVRAEITGRFAPERQRDFASATRDPGTIPSIRSWLISCLIWTDADSEASTTLLLDHVSVKHEPARGVRFWALAGLYQRGVPYLPTAIEMAQSDPEPEVRSLALAVGERIADTTLAAFRDGLASELDAAWPILRVLRVVPIVELVPDICALLARTDAGSTLGYDALYALTHPDLARAAAGLLAENPGVETFVHRVVHDATRSNGNAVRNFASILTAFDPAAVDVALGDARRRPATADAAGALARYLREFRRPRDGRELLVAGYASDTNDTQVDDLDIDEDVQTLAAVMLAKDVAPPLAIGLFGDWGSGKSYFMAAMRNASRALAERAKESTTSAFCSEIVSIEFNAWHYADTNLWASLVSHILQRLAAYVTPQLSPEEQEKSLLSELGSAKALVAEAEKERTETQAVIVERQSELRKLSAERRSKEVRLEDLRASDLRKMLDQDPKVKAAIDTALTQVGVPSVMRSFSDLSAVLDEAYSLRGRVTALFVAMVRQPLVLGLVGVALVAIPALAWAIGAFTKSGTAAVLGTLSAQGATMLTGGVMLLRRGLAGAKASLERLEAVKQQVDVLIEARRQAPTPEEETLEADIAGLAAKELAAEKRLDAAAQRVLELEERIRSVRENRSLARFLAERTRSEDYRKHLGLISTIRQDFESLGERLMHAAGAQAANGDRRVDRIVLYIDDLDRCPADKVMDVLQAVHLLLAFPLFVVVVGVDPRWLLHSLGRTYSAFKNPDRAAANERWKTTPQNYLEKIFQIPFTLRPMTETGYSTLMKRLLTAPVGGNGTKDADATAAVETREAPESDVSSSAPAAEVVVRAPAENMGAPTGDRDPNAKEKPSDGGGAPRPRPQARAKFRINDDALTVRPWEALYAEQLFPLIPTARAAKRFSNVYRLLKAPLPSAALRAFEGTAQLPGDFRVPMTLLAIVIGAAGEAVSLFPAVQASALAGEDPVDALLGQPSTGNHAGPALQRLRSQLRPVVNAPDFPRSPALFAAWLPRVSRFSFELAGIVSPLHAGPSAPL